MPVLDKNSNALAIGDWIRYPLNSAKTITQVGKILEIIEKNDGSKIITIEPLKEKVTCNPGDLEKITSKYTVTVLISDIKDVAIEYDDIVKKLE